MMGELHIVILWEAARKRREEAEALIKSRLDVVLICEYFWDPYFAAENYAAFYGDRLENIQYKVDHCGRGPFLVYIVRDNSPLYGLRETSSGKREVNVNMFDLKMELRTLAGGGHRVHASDNEAEARLNAASLFRMSLEELIGGHGDGTSFGMRSDIAGARGWESWDELFRTLNCCTRFVVLRNFYAFSKSEESAHGDTDLLVEDGKAAETIIAGRKVFPGDKRVLFKTVVGGNEELIDIRRLGDGYYADAWEKHMLDNRQRLGEAGAFAPEDEDYKYSLLYHALVQKAYVADDYREILRFFFGGVERRELRELLDKFLQDRGYTYTLPEDGSVFINPEFFSVMPHIPFIRRLVLIITYRRHKNGKRKKKSGLRKRLEALYPFLSRQYYLAVSKLRKIKKAFKKPT